METQTQLSDSSAKIQIRQYKHHETSVGSNLMTVDRFIGEYAKRISGGKHYTDIGEYQIPRELRDYIEAKAVYVELRHPFGRED